MRNLGFSVAYLVAIVVSFPMLLSRVVNSVEEGGWQPGIATWYGPQGGDGSDGGACGYGSLVSQTPFASRITAVGPALFKEGKGCGECYQVKCKENGFCSETPVTVVVTDECPGCREAETHFDLSGSAFSNMAVPPKASDLRNAGQVNILFRRVPCEYPGKNIAFHVNGGSSDYSFSVLIEYEDGDGDLGAVYLKQANSETWEPMRQSWGANWVLDSGPLKAPFSIRLQSLSSSRTLTANEVVPQNWEPNATYRSLVNFD